MNNILVGIAVVLIAIMTALFAAPSVIDWNSYRGVIEEEATRLLGRDVRVGGEVSIRLLPTPTFSVEQVRIADTEAKSGDPFFRADAISGKLSVAPLLRGALQVSEIVLKKPLVHLVYDEQGGGNWTSLGSNSSRLPFLAGDVALQSVRIEAGLLVVKGADRTERLRLEAIDGELSASALDGPFRFRGNFGIDGNRRELRLTTSKQESDGGIRFKAGLKHHETGAVYAFDARASDLGKGPRVEGELVAQVPLPQFSGQAGSAGSVGPSGGKSDEAPVEVKAVLSADAKLLKLGNLTLAFERMGRPQILTGEAEFDLGDAANVRVALAAKWLDVDQLIGAGPSMSGQSPTADPKHGPVSGLITLATRLNGFVPESGRASLILEVEQANLGAEPVSGLRLVLSGRGGETNIQELHIGLPGGSRADLKGLMTGSGEETAFNGDIVLRGASLARFLAWSTAGGFVLDPARDGRFSMRSKLSAAPGGIFAKEFVGELAGTVVQGELGYKWGARREISILVEGPQVDLRPLMSAAPSDSRSPLLGYLTAGAALSLATKDLDAVYRVRSGQLILPSAVYQDAVADIEFRNGRVRIEQLKLITESGVTVDLDGEMPTSAVQPQGSLRGTVSAQDPVALAALIEFLALPSELLPDKSRWNALVPAKLAGSVTFGLATDAPLSVIADGDLSTTHVRIKANLAKGLAAVRTSPLDLAASLKGVNAEAALEALVGMTSLDVASPATGSSTTIVLAVTGIPDQGLSSLGTWSAEGLLASYRGKVTTRGPPGSASRVPPLDLDGDVVIETGDIRNLRRFWRSAPRLSAEATAALVRARIESSGEDIKISGATGRIGDSGIGGDLQIITSSGGQRITGAIDVSALHWPTLLAMISQPDPQGSRSVAAWPETRFALGGIAKLDGELRVHASRTSVLGDVRLDNSRFTATFGQGQFEIRDFEARSGGGLWSGGLKLDQGSDGVTTGALNVRLRDGQLAEFTGASGKQAPVSGPVSGTLTLSGRGISAQDLAGSLSGRGTAALGDLRLSGLTPARLADALDVALKGPADGLVANLRRKLAETPSPEAAATMSARTLAITIARGVATVPPVAVDTPAGRSTIVLGLDLATLDLTGSTRVEAVPKPTSSASWAPTVAAPGVAPPPAELPLPPVTTTFVVRAGAFHMPAAETTSEPLERELAVRKLERDTLELERIRKQDEEREKVELERRTQVAPLPAGSVPLQGATVPSTTVVAPQPVEPSPAVAVPVPTPRAPPAAAQPQPKPAYRPLDAMEQKRLFGGN